MQISLEELRALAPKGDERILEALLPYLPSTLRKAKIESRLRFCHFIAQAAHETDGFRTLVEYGSADYFNKRYGPQTAVGRKLGNTQPGDGARFRGRGIFQLTGRFNYGRYGKKIGVNLVARPTAAADPNISLTVACAYWNDRELSPLADADDLVGITKRINGGTNGLKDRAAYLNRAKEIWPHDFLFEGRPTASKLANLPEPEEPEELDDVPAIATEPPPPLAKSKTLWGSITSAFSGGGVGFSLNALLENPHALWIVAAVLGFALIAGLALLIVFRERIAKRVELGI